MFDQKVCNKAIQTLKAGEKQEDCLWLVISLAKIPYRSTLKPVLVPLPHTPYTDEKLKNICVFSKDPCSVVKATLKEANIRRISKVIPVSKLKKKYASFEAKRELAAAFDMFLADTRISPMLPKLIGKSFYSRNKIPLLIDLAFLDAENVSVEVKSRKLKEQVAKVLQSTFFLFNNGPCISMKVGHTGQSTKDLLENLKTICESLNENIPDGGLENIRSMHVKTSSSPSIPIYLTSVVTTN